MFASLPDAASPIPLMWSPDRFGGAPDDKPLSSVCSGSIVAEPEMWVKYIDRPKASL